MSSSDQKHNPYVGPRAYKLGESLYGRERETRDLTNLLIAERIVLLYSPSGAGKSSLIHAAIIPRLDQEGFNIWPTVSLKREVGDDPQVAATANPYVLSTLLSLEESVPEDEQRSLEQLSRLSLEEYFEVQSRPQHDKTRFEVLVFDQFEEILTLDPIDIEHKTEFFKQLGAVLKASSRWALFGMREEYLAGLDPYLKFVPTRLSNHYRLDLLDEIDAGEAILEPAKHEGVTFTADAVKLLVRNLQGVTDTDKGNRYIEPVQLQVVCLKLWDKLKPEIGDEIDDDDLGSLSDVDSALSDYYATGVSQVARVAGISEQALRDWFEKSLLTRDGIRRQTRSSPAGADHDGPDPIRELENYHLVRTEERRGARWIELSHDRLVDAVIRNNSFWRVTNLPEFQRRAWQWDKLGRPREYLISGENLQEAESWIDEHEEDITDLDKRYFEESTKWQAEEQKLAETEGMISRMHRIATVKTFTILLLLMLLGVSVYLYRENETLLEENKEWAVAESRMSRFITSFYSDPELYMLLTVEALSTSRVESMSPQQHQSFIRRVLSQTPKTRVLRGHSYNILDVEFLSDGYLVTSDVDATIRVWNSATGLERQTLYFHNSKVNALAVNFAGSLLASAADDGTVAIWNIVPGTGKCELRYALVAHDDGVQDVNFSPDGRIFATAGRDGFIKTWDLESGRLLASTRQQEKSVNTVAFGPDGLLMASGDEGGNVVVWNSSMGQQRWRYPKQDGPINKVAFGPRGETVAAAVRNGDAITWKISTGRELSRVNHGYLGSVTSLVFGPDGKRLVTGGFDHTARIWEVSKGKELRSFSGSGGYVNAVALSPEGGYLAIASDNTARVLDLASSDATRYTADVVLELDSKVRISPDGKLILVSEWYNGFSLWDAENLEVIERFDDGVNLNDIAMSADGRYVAAAGPDRVRIWSLDDKTDQPVELQGLPDGVTRLEFSPDGKFLATAGRDRVIRLHSPATGDLISELPQSLEKEIGGLAFSPDSMYLVGVDYGGELKIWRVDDSSMVSHKEASDVALLTVDFSPDGKTLVTGGKDRKLRLYDFEKVLQRQINRVDPKQELKGHQGNINEAVFDSSGTTLATASYEGSVRIWDVRSGILKESLSSDSGGIASIDISPAGDYLAVARVGGNLQIYALGFEEVIAQAKTQIDRYLTDEECRKHLQRDCSENALKYFDQGRKLVSSNAKREALEQAAGYFEKALELDPGLRLDLEEQQDRWRMSGLYTEIRDQIYFYIDLPFTEDDRDLLEKLIGDVESWSRHFADPSLEASRFVNYQLAGRILDEGFRQARAGNLRHAAKYFELVEIIDAGSNSMNGIENFDTASLTSSESRERALQRANRIYAYELISKATENDIEGSIAGLEEAVNLYPESGMAYNRLGAMLRLNGEYEKAREKLTRAIELEPGNPSYMADLAGLLSDIGESRVAMQYAESAIYINPNLSEPRLVAAYILLDRDEPDQAISHLSNININDTNYVEALKISGPTYFDRVRPKQFEAAYQHVRQILEVEPSNYSYLASYAEAALVTSRLRESLEVAQKIIDLDIFSNENRIIALYIKTASLLLQNETRATNESIADFVEAFNGREAGPAVNWTFDGEKHYICNTAIATHKKALLLKIIAGIEGNSPKLDYEQLTEMNTFGEDADYSAEVRSMCRNV